MKNLYVYCSTLWFLSFLYSCNSSPTPSYVKAEGSKKSTKDKLLSAGANLLQSKGPLKNFATYLDGFHFYNGNMQAQMEAHHYISQLNNDMYQAIIFDGNGADAKIMGIEYIITARLFKVLPKEEKLLWHSHHYEVKSGELIAPGLPQAAEHELMKKLVSTYGKTIHTWHTDQDWKLPIGSPMLMMGFTGDGQINNRLLTDRDKRFAVSTAEKKQNRADIPMPAVDPDANAWQKGAVRQFVITSHPDSALHKHQMKVSVERQQ
ncbi:MAG: DUF1264 domain-containing protein [Sphingobacteriaceae bacterium]|nr:MAG: DUF1264 domain-containing protein [Sphingobacteriaceae bacterium]